MKNKARSEDISHNAKLLTTLLDVSNLVSSSTMELKPLLEAILEKLSNIIEYDAACIYTLSGKQMKAIAYRSGLNMPFGEISLPQSAVDTLISDKKPVLIDGKIMALPMVSKNKVIGLLVLNHNEAGHYKEQHIEPGLAFANQAAIEYQNAKLYNETVKRADEIRTMFNIQQAITSKLELDVVLKLIADEARRLSNAQCTAVFLVDGDSLVLSVFSGEQHDGLLGLKLPLEGSEIGDALKKKESVIIDFSKTEHMHEDKIIKIIGMQNCICVPLFAGTKPVGAIAAFSRKKDEFDSEDERIFNMFAPSAVIGIENAKLKKQAEEMAVAAERNRLARDLHDSVTQTLFSASLIAEVLPKIWEKNPENGIKRLEEIRQLTRGALAEMRTLLFELRPATLVEAQLGELLRQLSEAVTGRGRIPVALSINASEELPAEVKISFYRIAQEALNNIAKHSGAKSAKVELNVRRDKGGIEATLCITDDGKGFDPSKVTSEHLGLGIMKERAEAIGASLALVSKEGEGTVVCLTWSDKKDKD